MKLKFHNSDSIFFVANNLTRDYLLPQSQVNDASLSAGYPIYRLNKHFFEKSFRTPNIIYVHSTQLEIFQPSHFSRISHLFRNPNLYFSMATPADTLPFMSLLISMAFPSVCVPHPLPPVSVKTGNIFDLKKISQLQSFDLQRC